MKIPVSLLLVIIGIMLMPVQGSAQNLFSKVYFDVDNPLFANAIVPTPDKGYMVSGVKGDGLLLARLDSTGAVSWSKKVLTNMWYYGCTYIVPASDGSYIVAGNLRDTANSLDEIICLKITPDCDTLWTCCLSQSQTLQVTSLTLTADNGCLITGSSWQSSIPNTNMAVAKLSADGNLEWSKSYSSGNYETSAYHCAQSPDGGFIVCGRITEMSPYMNKAFLMKLTSTGSVSWIRQYFSVSHSNAITDFCLTSDGIVFCLTNDYQYNLSVVKTDFEGNILWAKSLNQYFGWMWWYDHGVTISTLEKGGFILIGGSGQVCTLDAVGNVVWSRSCFFYGTTALQTPDGGCVLMGSGPVIGVKHPGYNPQFGIIRTDSLGFGYDTTGYGYDCIYDYFTYESSTDTVMYENLEAITMNGCTRVPAQVSIEPTVLSWEDGCVAYIGGMEEDVAEKHISIFPNPSTGLCSVTFAEKTAVLSVHVYDASGIQVLQILKPASNPLLLDLSAQPEGMYFVKAFFRNGTASGKIILSK